MCHVGHAVMTNRLPIKAAFVIHAVGPYWADEEKSLLSACREALIWPGKEVEILALAPR